MRLWHYKMIPYLPNSQLWLIAQWRELNSIFKNQNKHILINYVYEYDKANLLYYTKFVLDEMISRGFKNIKMDNYLKYFEGYVVTKLYDDGHAEIVAYQDAIKNPFQNHHNDRYLMQCFYNLQEKYDRGQKDFSAKQYKKLEEFIKNEIH